MLPPETTQTILPLPASPVNVVGRIDNPDGLKSHSAGETVIISLSE